MKDPVKISQDQCPTAVLEAARRHVAQRWPDLAAVQPTVTRRDEPSVAYTLTYRGGMLAPDGQSISRTVRLTIDGQGKVLKSVGAK